MNGILDQPIRIRRWTLFVYWTLMFLATHWPDIDRWAPARLKLLPNFDKVIHTCMYGGWVVIWWWLLSCQRSRISRAAIGWLLVGGMAYAAFDEISQGWVERDPEVADWAFDVFGMVLAVLILQILSRRRARGNLR